MRIRFQTRWQAKAGNNTEEYEDAYYPRRSGWRSAACLRFAIADGATESSFSGQWARQLVEAFGRGTLTAGSWSEDLVPIRTAWHRTVSAQPLPWYAERKLQSGAYSAFVGLEFHDNADGVPCDWNAHAVGDSCLFIVRDDTLVEAFPLTDSLGFGSTPYLVGSLPESGDAARRQLTSAAGSAVRGDAVYLLTDALAQWFLRRAEAGGSPWNDLTGFSHGHGRRAFARWVAGQRRTGMIRNDDTTMVLAVLG